MNIITRFIKQLEYRHYLKKFEESIAYMNICVDGTKIRQGYAELAMQYLDNAIRIKEELDS